MEDRIRTGKDSGLGRFPSRLFALNAAWLELAMVGIDLLAFNRTLLLDGEHALAEPKKLRYRLLHVAARLVRTVRRTHIRIAQRWPWARDLASPSARLDALPRPIGRPTRTVDKGQGERRPACGLHTAQPASSTDSTKMKIKAGLPTPLPKHQG